MIQKMARVSWPTHAVSTSGLNAAALAAGAAGLPAGAVVLVLVRERPGGAPAAAPEPVGAVERP
ncbi:MULTISPECIES: hypothetical protein [unclassified Streptomyces]|uniref:hypothetical protein n=1 Tax=unclassified Streptomyces TaxID=2593676 RepID=UPI00039A6CE7|nr:MULTISPECIES: hypothetical protein [unclassified Streptomyces]